jgi:hypothetical protein
LGRAIGLAPPPVRFDYVVRTRPVKKAELEKWRQRQDESHPQREAVLFALRELTGKDHGKTTEEWVKAFPTAEPEVRSVRLADRLVKADPLARMAMVQTYYQGKGIEYTWALGRAIPKLTGNSQEIAKLALANRMKNATVEELREALRDRHAEVRRAAIRLCGQRNQRELIPELIGLLDGEATTTKLVREVLKTMTGEELPDMGSWRKRYEGIARSGE